MFYSSPKLGLLAASVLLFIVFVTFFHGQAHIGWDEAQYSPERQEGFSDQKLGVLPTSLPDDPAAASTHDATAPSASLEQPVLGAPADYWVQPPDDDWCESLYGPGYMKYIASHHASYCEASRPARTQSTLECFRTSSTNEFCIARGVALKSDPSGERHTSMDCQARNFTNEKLQSAQAAQQLENVNDIEQFGDYFFSTGAGNQLKYWDINPSEHLEDICTAEHNDGKYYLLIRREGNNNLWHKLMELWQAQVSLDVLQMALEPSTKQPYLPINKVPEVQVVFEDNEVGPVYDLWGMLTGSPPTRLKDLPAGCKGHVILPLAGSTSPFWQSHWETRDCTNRFMLDTFLRRIYRHLEIEPKPRQVEETVVTIIDRKKTRRIINLEKYVAHLRKRYPDVTVNAVDFAELSLRQQIITMRNTDVLVGVIGAGMTHLMFLPRQSTVAEIIPPGTEYAGFRNLAKMRGLGYYKTHGLDVDGWEALSDRERMGDGVMPNSKKIGDTEESLERRGDWQNDEWLYMTDAAFQALVDAAIEGQYNRGLRHLDVKPKELD